MSVVSLFSLTLSVVFAFSVAFLLFSMIVFFLYSFSSFSSVGSVCLRNVKSFFVSFFSRSFFCRFRSLYDFLFI